MPARCIARRFSLHPGTRYQVSMVEVVVGGFQTIWWVSLRYFRDDKGYTFAERGIESLKPLGIDDMTRTGVIALERRK